MLQIDGSIEPSLLWLDNQIQSSPKAEIVTEGRFTTITTIETSPYFYLSWRPIISEPIIWIRRDGSERFAPISAEFML